MFSASHYTLTLIRHPLEKHLRPVNLLHTADIPLDTDLGAYTTEHAINEDGAIEQFDLWLITECEDLTNNGAISFTRNAELTDIYTTEIRNNGIWSMKMERYPRGWTPCILLGNSLLHDNPGKITQELLLRISHLPPIDPQTIRVEYVTVPTTSRRPHVMCHCIFVEPVNYTEITNLCTLFSQGDENEYPVTGAYELLVLPANLTSSFDQELNQALVRHLTYMHSNTHTTLLEIPNVNIFHYVPNTPKMIEIRIGTGAHTIYTLLRHGSVTLPDGTRLLSPVRQVAPEGKCNRVHLYAEKQHARDLVIFTTSVSSFFPTWIPGSHEPRVDTSDAKKTIRITSRTLNRESDAHTMVSSSTLTTRPHNTLLTDDASQSLSNHTDCVLIPREEWSKAMDLMSQMAQRLQANDSKLQSTDEKMDRILDHLRGVPRSTTPIDDIISTLTQTIISSSDSLREYGHQIVDSATKDISSTIALSANRVTDLCNGLTKANTQVTTDLTATLSIVSAIADHIRQLPPHIAPQEGHPSSLEETTDHTPNTRLSSATDTETHHDLTSPLEGANSLTLTTHPTPTTNSSESQQTITIAPPLVPPTTTEDFRTPSDTPNDSTQFKSHTNDSSEDDTVETQLSLSPDPNSGMNTSSFGHCYVCNKIDGDTEACDHCELPHHQRCLIRAPTDGDNRYCTDCMQSLFRNPTDRQTNPSSEDRALSEHLDESDYSSHLRTVRQAQPNQADMPPPRYKLRMRKK